MCNIAFICFTLLINCINACGKLLQVHSLNVALIYLVPGFLRNMGVLLNKCLANMTPHNHLQIKGIL